MPFCIVLLVSNLCNFTFLYISIGTNLCAKNNGGCSHLCFYNGSGVVCGCASGFSLTKDGRNCIGTQEFILYTTTTGILLCDPNFNKLCSMGYLTNLVHLSSSSI